MNNYINDLISISRYAGQRFDLVQAGGGNSSVKLDNGKMLIKASGFHLSDVSIDSGYSIVNNDKVYEILNNKIIKLSDKKAREIESKKLIDKATISDNFRPSIETLLHAILKKYTLHTHAIALNIILSSKTWKTELEKIFQLDYCTVKYETPGIDLAIELKKSIKKLGFTPNIIFLQNHGLIVTSDKLGDIFDINELVLSKVEKHLKLDFEHFRNTNHIYKLLSKEFGYTDSVFHSNDIIVHNFLNEYNNLITPFNPDTQVYCGYEIIILESINDFQSIKLYLENYNELPKIFILEDKMYIRSKNFKKFKEIEDVLKSHLIVSMYSEVDNINKLDRNELDYLSSWEAEKYRQNL